MFFKMFIVTIFATLISLNVVFSASTADYHAASELFASIVRKPVLAEKYFNKSPYEVREQQDSREGEKEHSAAEPVHHQTHCDPKHCVPYHSCKENKTINTDGAGIIDVRFNAEEPCHYLEVCCHPENHMTATETIPTTEHINDNPYKCGYRNKYGLEIQIKKDDNEAQFGEFPWMMAILQQNAHYGNLVDKYICGGSLIHPEIILTAAHCVYSTQSESLKVRGGEWDTQTTNEHYPHQERFVKEFIIHENFDKEALQNDIALIFVKEAFKLIANVRTVCLPPTEYNFVDYPCHASGWGKNIFGKEGRYSAILKRRDMPVVETSNCQKLLRTTRLGQHFNLHKSFICAGGENGVDMCKGDGGSPLVCPADKMHERYFQSGIVAWGIGCGSEKVPGVYASVSYFREWIDAVFLKYGYDQKYYKYE